VAVICHYSFGNINVDGKEYTHDVIVSGRTVKEWWRNTSHEVSINDVAPVLDEKPQLVIFGTGASGVCRVFPETIEYLEKQGIKALVYHTPEAVKEFNRLSVAQGGVVGAFHLTC
jgi:hypothetical protein